MTEYAQILTRDSQAMLLLVGRLSRRESRDAAKPLTTREYNELARWLVSQNLTPGDLHDSATRDALRGSPLRAELVLRIDRLLRRGAAMAVALEEWTAMGMWVLGRTDPDYPKKLRARLKARSPIVLYGFGDLELLRRPALAVVGSRNADAETLQFVRRMASLAAEQRWAVVSGGARGVDQEAMRAAIEASGSVVGVLAGRLRQQGLAHENRQLIQDGRLLLLSPFSPDAPFSVGAAMGRNSLIYCLSDTALVGSSDADRGGTWAGATENLKHGWVPLCVRSSATMASGNRRLIERGAIAIDQEASEDKLRSLLHLPAISSPDPPTQVSGGQLALEGKGPDRVADGAVTSAEAGGSEVIEPTDDADPLLTAVWPVLASELTDELPPHELAERVGLSLAQVKRWLARAVRRGWAQELKRPKRYTVAVDAPRSGRVSTHQSVFEAAWRVLGPKLRSPISARDLAAALEVGRTDLMHWLAEAVARGWVAKSRGPVRYKLTRGGEATRTDQLSLLRQ